MAFLLPALPVVLFWEVNVLFDKHRYNLATIYWQPNTSNQEKIHKKT